MGLATILEARHILLLANGPTKANAVYAIIKEPITSDIPATILRRHCNVQLIVDPDAVSLALRNNPAQPVSTRFGNAGRSPG